VVAISNIWFVFANAIKAPPIIVIPAHAGIHKLLIFLDTGLRRCDENRIILGAQ